MTHDELPTLDNLAKRNPKIYGNHQTCPTCGIEKETRSHLFNCPSTQNEIYNTQSDSKDLLLEKLKDKIKPKETLTLTLFLDNLQAKTTNSPQGYFKLIIGIISKEETNTLATKISWSHNRSKETLLNFSNLLREQFREKIWKPRCKEINNMEKTLGITKKTKKTKLPKDFNSK